MVCIEPIKLNDESGVLPAASETIIVSPIALEIANTIEAMMPDNAAGNTIFVASSSLVAPQSNAPSLIESGNELIAYTLILIIIGINMSPTNKPGLIEIKLLKSGKSLLNIGVTKVKAKKP